MAGAAALTNRSTIRWTLHQLVASGVVGVYDAGTEPVWGIGADQHLAAAFYRNTAIHILVDRAIAETALLAAVEDAETSVDGQALPTTVRDEAQWEPQRRLASAESRSMEPLKTARRLAGHRELVDAFEYPDVARRRRDFADEIATAIRRGSSCPPAMLLGGAVRLPWCRRRRSTPYR